MKKFFAIAALAVMFTLAGCGCGQTEMADTVVDSAAIEVVDSNVVDTFVVVDTVIDTIAE